LHAPDQCVHSRIYLPLARTDGQDRFQANPGTVPPHHNDHGASQPKRANDRLHPPWSRSQPLVWKSSGKADGAARHCGRTGHVTGRQTSIQPSRAGHRHVRARGACGYRRFL